MARSENQYPAHLVFGVIFGLIAIVALIGLVMVNTQADDTSQTVGISNSTPSISGLSVASTAQGSHLSGGITTTESGVTVYVHGTATDLNGCYEIDKVDGDGVGGDADSSLWQVALYRNGDGITTSCTADGLNCYQVSVSNAELSPSNSCDSASDTSIDFSFDVALQYYIDATDAGSSPDKASQTWKAAVSIEDDEGATGTGDVTVEVNTFNSLDVDASMDYGTPALGADSAEQTFTVENKGNFNNMYPKVSQAAAWSCEVGTITSTNLWVSSDSKAASGTGRSVSSSAESILDAATELTSMTIAKASDSGTSTASVYATLAIPSTGVGGDCTSTMTFAAATTSG